MKKVKVLFNEGNVEYETTFTFKVDQPKKLVAAREQEFIDATKRSHPNATNIRPLIEVDTPEIDKKTLMEVGREVASGWGAECLSVKAYKTFVIFNCIEYGDRFTTTLTYDDIKKDYKNCLK